MNGTDLNIFVSETIAFFIQMKERIKQTVVATKEFFIEVAFVIISAARGFLLLINGPPRGDQVSSPLYAFLCPFNSFFSIGKLSWR